METLLRSKFTAVVLAVGVVGAALLILPLQVEGAAAFVQANEQLSFGPTTLNVTLNSMAAGNAVVLGIHWDDASASISSVTDNCSEPQAYTVITGAGYDSKKSALAYNYNITGGNCTISVNFSEAADEAKVWVHEVSGILTTDPFDGSTSTNTSFLSSTCTDCISSGDITTTADGDYIFGIAMSGSTVGLDPGTGFTRPVVVNNFRGISEYMVQGSAGSVAATFSKTDTNGAEHNVSVLALKAIPPPPQRLALVKPPNNLGLVGYWGFNDGVGAVATDFSGRSNHGTLVSDTTWVNGMHGKALTFDGSDDHLSLGTPNLLTLSSAMTACVWLKYDPASVTSDGAFIGEVASGATDGWLMWVDNVADAYSGNTDTISFGVNVDQSGGRVEGTTGLVIPGAWDHYCGTFQGNSFIRLYKNGVLNAEITEGVEGVVDAVNGNTGYPLIAGAIADSGRPLDGSLDEIRLYNRALTATEVAALYGRGTGASGAVQIGTPTSDLHRGSSLSNGLVGHWTFDGPDTQTTIADRSGEGNHGGFIGGATSSAKTSGVLGQSLRFDGSDDYVGVGDVSILDGSTQASACAWVKYTLPSVTTDGTLVSKYHNVNGPDLLFWVDDVSLSGRTNTIAFLVDGNEERVDGSTDLVTPGVWDHYCGVFQGSTYLRLYKNGALDQENTSGIAASVPISAVPLQFGDDNTFNRRLPGMLDDVRIYNRALTPAEVKQLYNLGQVTIQP